jgi:hypothetical protein
MVTLILLRGVRLGFQLLRDLRVDIVEDLPSRLLRHPAEDAGAWSESTAPILPCG